MKYRNFELNELPTVELIKSYLILHDNSFQVTAQEVYDYWEAKGWKTKKGREVLSLENAVSVCNSIVIEKERARKRREKKKKEKEEKGRINKKKEVVVLETTKDDKEYKRLKKRIRKDKKTNRVTPPILGFNYGEQLKMPYWYAFRKFIFIVRGKKCEQCGAEENLQVHHLKYISGRLAWEYTCNEVKVLCKDCHMKVHGIKKENE